ncbi:MAG: retroviral-like aspartic protease family protein [Oscillospiraceae bacterium]|nr:retroviral-like aspartic protease family protein [Oscillospiraceae bacterium]
MKFTIKNRQSNNYLTNYKPFTMWATAFDARGARFGYAARIPALIDTGAKNTFLGKSAMDKILAKVKDVDGNPLKPQGCVATQGVHGGVVELPWYIIPNLSLMGADPKEDAILLRNVAVVASNSDNVQCLIGRSILHQCILMLDPLSDAMHFDFDDRLRDTKQTIGNTAVFEEVSLFAEAYEYS